MASMWSPAAWQRQRVPLPAGLSERPIDRDEATLWAQRIVVDDPATVLDAFIVAMIWGHGPAGYGAWRTRELMTGPGFTEAVTTLVDVAREQGGVAAY